MAGEVLGAAEFRGVHGNRFKHPLHGLVAGLLCWNVFRGVGRKAKQTGFRECLHRQVQVRPGIHRYGESFLDEDVDGSRNGRGMACRAQEVAFGPVCEARRNLAPVVDSPPIRIETEEFHSTGWQDDSFA